MTNGGPITHTLMVTGSRNWKDEQTMRVALDAGIRVTDFLYDGSSRIHD